MSLGTTVSASVAFPLMWSLLSASHLYICQLESPYFSYVSVSMTDSHDQERSECTPLMGEDAEMQLGRALF